MALKIEADAGYEKYLGGGAGGGGGGVKRDENSLAGSGCAHFNWRDAGQF